MTVLIDVMVAALLAAAPPTSDEKVRVLSSTQTSRTQVEAGDGRMEVEWIDHALQVHVTRTMSCTEETIRREKLLRYREDANAQTVGGATVSAGVVLAGASVVAAYASKDLPSINDQFSRGELSREAAQTMSVVGVIGGTLGVIGGTAYYFFAREQRIGENTRDVVVESTPVECDDEPLAGAIVDLSRANGAQVSKTADDDGTARFLVDEDVVLPAEKVAWATLEVRLDGAVVASANATPPVNWFLTHLLTSQDAAELEAFRRRFPDEDRAWSQLKGHYTELVAKREAATRADEERVVAERRERQERFASLVRRALARKEILGAVELVATAEAQGLDTSALKGDVEKVARREGEACLRRAVLLAKKDDVDGAEKMANEAERLGVTQTHVLRDALAAARLRVGTAVAREAELAARQQAAAEARARAAEAREQEQQQRRLLQEADARDAKRRVDARADARARALNARRGNCPGDRINGNIVQKIAPNLYEFVREGLYVGQGFVSEIYNDGTWVEQLDVHALVRTKSTVFSSGGIFSMCVLSPPTKRTVTLQNGFERTVDVFVEDAAANQALRRAEAAGDYDPD